MSHNARIKVRMREAIKSGITFEGFIRSYAGYKSANELNRLWSRAYGELMSDTDFQLAHIAEFLKSFAMNVSDLQKKGVEDWVIADWAGLSEEEVSRLMLAIDRA